MKLRTRIPISLGAILVVMLASMFLTVVNFVFEETKAIERNNMAGNIDRVLGALERDEDSLQTSVGDYAAWDDTYQFAQDNNQEYIDANFGSSSFTNLHVNVVAVLNEQRELVYARHVDWRRGEELEVPGNLQDLFRYHGDLFELDDPKDRYTDIVRLNGQLMFLAARPIVTSEYEGPITGTLVMMRHIDENYIQDLSSLTQLNLSILQDSSPETLQSIFAPEKLLAPNTQRVINFIDEEHMEAFFTLKNDEGDAEGVVRIDRDRTVNALAIDSLKNSMAFFFLFAVILILGSLGIVDRYILRRLSKLSNAVFHYGADPSQLTRCSVRGKDELTSLARAVQSAFHELDLSRDKIKDHADKSDLEKRKLEVILHSFGEGVFVVDHKGKIILINRTAKELAGRTNEELLDSPFYKHLKFVNEEEQSIAMDFLRPVLSKATYVKTDQDVRFIPKKGDTIHVSLAAAPIKKRSEVVGSVVVFADKTHEYEVDKMKSEFVSIASHQLRTPLTGIKWMVSLMLRGQAGRLTQKQLEFLHNIDSSNERMIQLVNDLLNVSRIESSKAKKLEKADCDLKKMIGDVLIEQQGIAQQLGISLAADTKGTSQVVEADHDKLYQVIMNLANNAIKYSRKGGNVHIGYSLEKGEKGTSFVRVSVSDSGIGIPKAQQSQIFQKFFRAANAVESVETGTGLGLYYVKMVVEAHGGRIWFDSILQKGTTFYFTLPVKA